MNFFGNLLHLIQQIQKMVEHFLVNIQHCDLFLKNHKNLQIILMYNRSLNHNLKNEMNLYLLYKLIQLYYYLYCFFGFYYMKLKDENSLISYQNYFVQRMQLIVFLNSKNMFQNQLPILLARKGRAYSQSSANH